MTLTELLDTIRTEIERRFWDYGTPLHDEEVTKKVDEILAILDPLQEQPASEDLENEADRMFFSLGWYEGDHHQPMLDCVSLEQFRDIARHFAEWGAKNAK